jgi:hypothetical protein
MKTTLALVVVLLFAATLTLAVLANVRRPLMVSPFPVLAETPV